MRSQIMTDTAPASDTARPRTTKVAIVNKLLGRPRGATLADIVEATGWQPHSARAFLSGLRKKGAALVREQRRDGATAYRIAKIAAVAEEAPVAVDA
jgi:hypothetical protein